MGKTHNQRWKTNRYHLHPIESTQFILCFFLLFLAKIHFLYGGWFFALGASSFLRFYMRMVSVCAVMVSVTANGGGWLSCRRHQASISSSTRLVYNISYFCQGGCGCVRTTRKKFYPNFGNWFSFRHVYRGRMNWYFLNQFFRSLSDLIKRIESVAY